MGTGMGRRESGRKVMLHVYSNSQPILKFIQSNFISECAPHVGGSVCGLHSKPVMVKED